MTIYLLVLLVVALIFKALKSTESNLGRNHSGPSVVHAENSEEFYNIHLAQDRVNAKEIYPKSNVICKTVALLTALSP